MWDFKGQDKLEAIATPFNKNNVVPTCFANMLKEKGIPLFIFSFLVSNCSVKNKWRLLKKKKVFLLEKSCDGEKLFEIQRVDRFYMTKQLHYKMPPASLERHQMYKDYLFLDFNCLIIPAAPKRLCRIKLISLWQSQCYSTLVWGTFSWRPHQASRSVEQKHRRRWAKNIFSTKEWLIDIND